MLLAGGAAAAAGLLKTPVSTSPLAPKRAFLFVGHHGDFKPNVGATFKTAVSCAAQSEHERVGADVSGFGHVVVTARMAQTNRAMLRLARKV